MKQNVSLKLINEIEEKKQVIKASTAEQCRLLSSGYTKQKEELKAAQAEIQESIILATTSLKNPVVKFLSSQESTCTKFDHVESKFQQLPLSVSRPQLLMVKVSDMQWQLEKYVIVRLLQQMDSKSWDLKKSLPKSTPCMHWLNNIVYTHVIIITVILYESRQETPEERFSGKELQIQYILSLHCVKDGSCGSC